MAGRSLSTLARALYEQRRARDRLFEAGPFGEPAWDILLDLFISGEEGRKASLEAVSAAASVPIGTAHRFIQALVAKGLVSRIPGREKVRAWLQLTDEGRARMGAALREMLKRRAS